MQVPSNMFAGKTRYPGVYICVAMGIWGVISACTAGVHNFTGLVVTRFFLGFVEAAFFPGALFYLSLFYSRKQFALRTAILYSGSQVGNAIGPLFAIGILNLDGSHGIEGWRWLFLIEGVLTIAFAIGFAFFLPNGLKNLSGFSEMEQEYLLWNYGRDIGQQDNKDEITAWKGLVMAAQDPKTWLLMGILWSVRLQEKRVIPSADTHAGIRLSGRKQLVPICCGHARVFTEHDIWPDGGKGKSCDRRDERDERGTDR